MMDDRKVPCPEPGVFKLRDDGVFVCRQTSDFGTTIERPIKWPEPVHKLTDEGLGMAILLGFIVIILACLIRLPFHVDEMSKSTGMDY